MSVAHLAFSPDPPFAVVGGGVDRGEEQAAVEAVGMAESVVESAIESAEAALSEADEGSGDEAPK